MIRSLLIAVCVFVLTESGAFAQGSQGSTSYEAPAASGGSHGSTSYEAGGSYGRVGLFGWMRANRNTRQARRQTRRGNYHTRRASALHSRAGHNAAMGWQPVSHEAAPAAADCPNCIQ